MVLHQIYKKITYTYAVIQVERYKLRTKIQWGGNIYVNQYHNIKKTEHYWE